MNRKIKSRSSLIFVVSLITMLFSIPANLLPSLFQESINPQQKSLETAAYAQTTSETDAIQCITIPCEYPSSQPIPPDSDIDDTRGISANGTQQSQGAQNNNSQNEPCISPCPPGEICIQMCQPIGQQETTVIESNEVSETQETDSIPSPDETSSETITTEEQSGSDIPSEETTTDDTTNEDTANEDTVVEETESN